MGSNSRKMKPVIIFPVLLCFLASSVHSQSFKKIQKKIKSLTASINSATTQVNALQISVRSALTNADAGSVFDATLSSGSTKCGAQTITGWTVNLDQKMAYADTTFSAGSQLTASTGRFVPAVRGYYKICAYFRFRNTGNSNDVTIRKNGNVIAAFGNAIQNDWRSTGTCVTTTLATTDYVDVHQYSGGSNDCIEETGWYYSRFMGHLIACDTTNCA